MMKTMKNKNVRKPNLTLAIDEKGKWKHVNEVKTGKDCNCFCPQCGAKLIAINSKPENESKAHHFAHERGSDCKTSEESVLHKLAKEVLSEEKKIMLPINGVDREPVQLEFESVGMEKRDEQTGLIPDCICFYDGKKLWVEFKRTHEVDTKKADRIREAKIDCIEIDLNACVINIAPKETLREFIVQNPSNREWVYNSKTQQTKVFKTRIMSGEHEYSERKYNLIERHIAWDDYANLVNLHNINTNYNISSHRYYCIHCNKELKIINNHFEHIEENKGCVDDIYLIEAAIEIVYSRFHNAEYALEYSQRHKCNKIESCPMADKERCSITRSTIFSLKDKGYIRCDRNFKVPGYDERYDIVIRKADSLKDAIFVRFSTEDCDRDFESGSHQIDIHLYNEDDIMRLDSNTLNIGYYRCFMEDSPRRVAPEEIGKKVYKCTLHKSGRLYIDHQQVPCTTNLSTKGASINKEFLLNWDFQTINEDAYEFSLLSCWEKKLEGCYCKICYFLQQNPGFKNPICIRYRTKGTPQFPLRAKPCNCSWFILDKEKANKIRSRFSDVKIKWLL